MKASRMMAVSVLIVAAATVAISQPRRMRQHEPPDRGRLEKFRTMQIVDLLKLNEEEAVRYTAKQSAHETAMHDLTRARNEIIDEIKEIGREPDRTKDLDTRNQQILDLDRKIAAERERYLEELRQFFTPDRFGRYLVFERDFARGVGAAMRERRFRDDR